MEKSPEAYKTISEAADELGVEQHVLRFWETKFLQIKPLKRQGGRRFYRPEDMEILRRIQKLLKDQGFTIKGAKQVLSQKKIHKTVDLTEPAPIPASNSQLDLLGQSISTGNISKSSGLNGKQKQKLSDMLTKLESLRNHLQSVA
jgi:DNA-binding transcriptional MerR regulator